MEVGTQRCILLAVLKNIVFFYGVSGPSAARDFILAMLQDLGFYVDLGSRRGPGRKNWHLKIGST